MSNYTGTFPNTRLRRLRQNSTIRNLVAQSSLSSHDLIAPYFIQAGNNQKTPIPSMPGCFRHTVDQLLHEVEALCQYQVPALALFPVIDPALKTLEGKEAFNPEGLVPEAIQAVKQRFPDISIICDVALDPYTSSGQDGIVNDQGTIENDPTIALLCKQALIQAQAGADILAPSDMMDGRIGAIRQTLEQTNHKDTMLLSYAAKYASSYYGPFREAVGSASQLGSADKKTYQMDPANANEAMREIEMDIQEGADMIMVKPGLPYLDIVQQAKATFGLPTFAYQVSGEYSMLKMAIENKLLAPQALTETLLCFKRAGADAIFTYFAKEIAETLADN